MKEKPLTPQEVVRAESPAAKAELYRLALREMEVHRDRVISACEVLQRLRNQYLKLAGLPLDDEPAPSADAVDPSIGSTGKPTTRAEESFSSSSSEP